MYYRPSLYYSPVRIIGPPMYMYIGLRTNISPCRAYSRGFTVAGIKRPISYEFIGEVILKIKAIKVNVLITRCETDMKPPTR
jgi:hypothetical protein